MERMAPDLETTLERIALGARILGMGWLILLGIVAIVQHGERIESVAWVLGPLAAASAWLAISSFITRGQMSFSVSLVALIVDGILASVSLLAPTLAGIGDVPFYGGLPLIVVAIGAVRSRTASWGAAAVFIVVVLTRTGVSSLGDVVGSITQIVMYSAAAFIFSWTVRVLRSSETQRLLASEAAARAEERAEISRHLHDSVLQTLALIQRASDRPTEVTSLARRQERELREWLYGTPRTIESGFGDSVRAMTNEVEVNYGLVVDLVVVGDAPVSPSMDALVAAGREALVNAAKHAGVAGAQVFAETSGSRARLFVRDRGRGFELSGVPTDRGGISGSIRERLQRVGGEATLRSEPNWGTEWRLEVPL